LCARTDALVPRDARARALVAGLAAFADDAPERAVRCLEAGLDDAPGDLLLAKLSHALRFLHGALSGMARPLEGALRALPPASEARGYVLGMYAFALEEAGALDEAERAAKDALALAPDDAWGAHALAHVHATRGDTRAGLALFEAL